VTEGDLLRRAETGTERQRPRWLELLLGPGRLANEYVHSHGRKVKEVMTPSVITVSADTPLPEVVRTMERRRIKRVPVVSDGKIVGIISRANLLQALSSLADEAKESRSDDETMRAQILAELNKQAWAPRSLVNVIGLSRNDSGGFVLSAALAVTVTGVDQKKAEELVESAHKICPYSNAIRGNVDVGITVSAR
jgi:predicted transcriptional regulator